MPDPARARELVEELLRRSLGQRADQVLRERMLRVLLETAVAGAARAAEDMSLPDALGPTHPTLQRLATEHLPKILGINETTREQLRDRLVFALAEGENLPAQMQVIRDTFTEATRSRSLTIARTENGIFWNGGNHAQSVDAGAIAHVWITSRDHRVRESHRPMDGQCQAIQTPFVTGAGARLAHPNDPAGLPEEIINCRCVEAPLVKGCETRSLLFGTAERRALYWKGAIRTIEARERVALRTIRSIFAEQRQAVLAAADVVLSS